MTDQPPDTLARSGPALTRPRQPATPEEVERRQQAQAQLRADYQWFNGEQGQRVLADLCAAFGWNKPSAVPGLTNEEVWLREGMKNPIRHILYMSSPIPELPKPLQATHE
jgi:hypothetical protein